MRMLVTGSRSWTDWCTLMWALSLVWEPDAVLICGACPRGADDLAARWWRYWGGRVEAWPAEWERYGRSAGVRRNAAMVAAGPDVCVAFVDHGSRGAMDTVARARAAGVPTFVWRR